jgi:hypothetical protein
MGEREQLVAPLQRLHGRRLRCPAHAPSADRSQSQGARRVPRGPQRHTRYADMEATVRREATFTLAERGMRVRHKQAALVVSVVIGLLVMEIAFMVLFNRSPPRSGSSGSSGSTSEAPFRFFSPTSFWNEALPANAALDPNSAAIVSFFDEQMAVEEEAGKGPGINYASWSVPVYTVPEDQPLVKVTLENAARTPALQKAWEAVPSPSNALPASGRDKHLVLWQPSTDHLWEFWHLEKTTSGWQAAWGGAMEKASSDPGVYGTEAWPGATRGWGASATSLSIAGGLITLEDLERGQINHALAMAINNPRGEVFSWPAQRTDGWSLEPFSLPEGAHLRLDPNLDLAALHLPKLTLMMAEAAQRYGIIIRDSSSKTNFYAQDPTPTGTNPYAGPGGYFEQKSTTWVLASFPWSHLQLLKMELHK